MTVLNNGHQAHPMLLAPPVEESHLCLEPGCGRTFPTLAALSGHQRSHGGRKYPFCRYCDFKASTARTAQHEQQCPNNPQRVPFQHGCEHCSETFPTRQGVSAHTTRTHKVFSDDPRLVRRRMRTKAEQAGDVEHDQEADESERAVLATRTRTLRLGDELSSADLLALLGILVGGPIPIEEAPTVIEWANASHALIMDLRASHQ